MTDYLEQIVAAVEAQEEVRARLIAALNEAVEDGHTHTELAQMLGISRVTLWRWMKTGQTKDGE